VRFTWPGSQELNSQPTPFELFDQWEEALRHLCGLLLWRSAGNDYGEMKRDDQREGCGKDGPRQLMPIPIDSGAWVLHQRNSLCYLGTSIVAQARSGPKENVAS
jgi:hypothetical protein